MKKLGEFRDQYESAPNEVKKSQIYKDASEYTHNTIAWPPRDVVWQGKVRSITTTKGGDDLYFSVEMSTDDPHAATVYLNSPTGLLGGGIKKKDPVYDQIGELKEGGCVRFKGTMPAQSKAKNWTEEGSMLSPEYTFKFESAEKCD